MMSEVELRRRENQRQESNRRLYTVRTVIEETELSPSTVNRLMKSGILERVKILNATRITGESYERLLASLTDAGKAA